VQGRDDEVEATYISTKENEVVKVTRNAKKLASKRAVEVEHAIQNCLSMLH
jgi:hypothetical protein